MKILFLPILIIIVLLLSALLIWRNRERTGVDPKKRRMVPRRDEHSGQAGEHPPSAQSVLEEVNPEAGVLAPELELSDWSERLKTQIRDGIESIFSAKPGMADERRKPLQVNDIRPEVMRVAVEHLKNLKDFDATYRLYKSIDDPNLSMSQLSKVIVTAPILSGKILKVANSAYFGMTQKVNSIGHALMIIGLAHVKNILYHEGLLKLLNVKSLPKDYAMESLWEHAAATSICASYIHHLFSRVDKGTLFSIGLLHDVGKFVIAGLPQIKQAGADFTRVSLSELSIEDEDELFGINHAVIGRLAFEQWGLSELMVKTVEMHHHPSFVDRDAMGLDTEHLKYLLLLFLSDQVAKLFANEERDVFTVTPLHPSYHTLVNRKRLSGLVLDGSLFSEIRKAKSLMGSYM
jgi:HD-like signal output (HDOD) protein